MKYTKWLVAQAGSTATPSRPPSPSVVTVLGTVPTWVRTPAVVTLNTLNESRSVAIAVWPSGIQAMPHGMVQPFEMVVMLEGAPPEQPAVVMVLALLGAETLPAASFATTVRVYVVLQASPVTVVDV